MFDNLLVVLKQNPGWGILLKEEEIRQGLIIAHAKA